MARAAEPVSPIWDGGACDRPEEEREGQAAWEDPSDGDLPWEEEKPADAPEPWKEGYPGSENPTPEETMFREMLDDEDEEGG